MVRQTEQNKSGITLIVIFDVILVVVALAFTWFMLSIFQKEVHSVSLRESRFLTIEWNLLQQYKQQVDKMLRSKDQEIAVLKEQYRQLELQGYSDEYLQEIDTALKRLEAEREKILSSRISRPIDEDVVKEFEATSTVLPESTPSESIQSGWQTAELLSAEIRSLKVEVELLQEELRKREILLQNERAYTAQLKEQLESSKLSYLSELEKQIEQVREMYASDLERQKTHISELEEQVKLLEAERSSLFVQLDAFKSAPSAENGEKQAQLESVASKQPPEQPVSALDKQEIINRYLSGAIEQVENELNVLRKEPLPSMESIHTRALLRALATTPLIRSTYPDLLESIDTAFADYGKQEYVKGQLEVYTSLLAYLRSLEAPRQ